MKRDMDLVRLLLFKIEEAGAPIDSRAFALTEEQTKQAPYHLRMLSDAEYIRGAPSSNGLVWGRLELTWAGHEFLDTLRDPTVWEKTKSGAAKVGGVGVDMLLGIAKEYLKSELRERLGLSL